MSANSGDPTPYGLGEFADGTETVVGDKILHDTQYNHCKFCPKTIEAKKFNYDVFYYLQ